MCLLASMFNNNDIPIIVSWTIVGIKKDGTNEMLSLGIFSAFDKEQYEKDLDENGWAIEKQTTQIAANSTMETEVKFVGPFASKLDLDVDKDGYFDIKFTAHLQTHPDYITTSTNAPVSDIYKIIANE